MKGLKENTLRDNQLSVSSFYNSTPSTSSSIDNSTSSFSSFTNNFTTRSNDTYIYDDGIVVLLSIGACVFSAYNNEFSHPVNKEQANKEQQQPIKPPKRRNML